jgi:hypothetical protein
MTQETASAWLGVGPDQAMAYRRLERLRTLGSLTKHRAVPPTQDPNWDWPPAQFRCRGTPHTPPWPPTEECDLRHQRLGVDLCLTTRFGFGTDDA